MRRALLALSGIVTCAGLVTALAANARFPQERVPGTIRVRVTLVPIDIIVTDKDDRPVTDLRQEDFTVIEDGVRQNIAHFSFQALTAIPVDPSAPTKGLLRKIPVAELTPETRRTFLIVLGRGRLQHPSRGIDGLLTFVRKAFLSYSRISSAAQYEEEVKDIGVQVRVHVVPAASGDGRRVQVDVMLQAPKIPFTEGGGRHVASVQVVTFYGDGHGRFLGESWQQLDLNLREETWQKVQKDGIPFSTRVPYQVPDQTFKIVVYSYDADKVGSVTTRLR